MSVNLLIMLLIIVVPFLQVLLFVNLFVLINLLSSSVVNKPTPSVDASVTFCTIVKCKNKFFDVWIQFLILFSLVTLNCGYLSFNVDCFYLKANNIVNNLTACLIFKYHIYNFSGCIGKIFFSALFKCFLALHHSNLYQCFLISIDFYLVCKLVSILSYTKSQFAFTFFTMSAIFRTSLLFGLQKGRDKPEKFYRGFFNTLLGES